MTQVGLSELQLHYQTMCKQVAQKKKMHHCKSQALVNNGSYNQGSYYRNAKSAAALVNPLTVWAVEVLHVQLHFWYPLNCGYVTWLYCFTRLHVWNCKLHLLPELQLWHGFKGWCNVSPLWDIYGQCGQCSPCWVQQQLKFALSTKIHATVKTAWLATFTTRWLP